MAWASNLGATMDEAAHSLPEPVGRDAQAMDTIRALAEGIGPRRCCSEGERAAAEWLAAQLREAGCEVETEQFPAYGTFMAAYAPLTMAGAVGLALQWWSPWVGGAVALAACAVLVLENRPVQLFSRLTKLGRSCNVIARRAPTGRPTQDIVVLAHIDSPVASDIRDLRVVRALFLGMVLSCGAVGGVGLALAVGAPHCVWFLGMPFALHLLICSGIMLHQMLRSPVVAGAGDNASGVAAMLQAARELPPLRHSTVWFVGDGGEEAGLLGAVRLLETQRFDRDRTWFINVDMVSGGELRVSAEEGMLFRYHCDRNLCRIAAEEGSAEGLTVPSEALRAMSTDACVPLSRGYRATTISSTEGYWHQLEDTVENVEPHVPAQAARVIRRMVVRLDAEVGVSAA